MLAIRRGFHYHNTMVLDLVVLGILVFSAAVAFMRGFVREVLTIGSLGGAAAATLVFGPSLSPVTRGWLVDPAATEPQSLFGVVPYEMLAPVVAYAIVFVAVLVVLTIITHMVSKGVHAVGLGPVDRSLGVVFGLVRGVVIVGLLSLVMNFVLKEEQRTEYFGASKTYPYVTYLADLTNALLPSRSALDKVTGHDGKEDTAALGDKAVRDARVKGSQPLEPGQKGAGKRSSDGYTGSQRRQMDDLVAQPETRRSTTHKGFNN